MSKHELVNFFLVDGGCTESAHVPVQTWATVPEGMDPPIPTPISQNLITVTWDNPRRANGPNIQFELMRKMLRQPLEGIQCFITLYLLIKLERLVGLLYILYEYMSCLLSPFILKQ